MNGKIKLIIGLGNPGKEYQNTYHNVGFLAADYLTKNPPNSPPAPRLRRAGKFQIPNYKSDVYMNLSGDFVRRMLKKHKIKPEELLVVHDDSDIGIGNYKLSFGRGSAGHKGVESIIKALKTKKFWRLRIGIRPDKTNRTYGTNRLKAGEFVLKKIKPLDKRNLEAVFCEIQDKIVT